MKFPGVLFLLLLPLAWAQTINLGTGSSPINLAGTPSTGGIDLGGSPSGSISLGGNTGGTEGIDLGGGSPTTEGQVNPNPNPIPAPNPNANPVPAPNPNLGGSGGIIVDPSADTIVPNPGTPGGNANSNNNNNNNNNNNGGFGSIKFPELNFGNFGTNFPSLPNNNNNNIPGLNGNSNGNSNNNNIPALDFDFGTDFSNFPSGPSLPTGFPNSGGSSFPSGGLPGFPSSGGSSGFPNGGSSGFPNGGSSGFPNGGSSGFPNGGSSGLPSGGPGGFPGGSRPGFPNIGFPTFPNSGSQCQAPSTTDSMVANDNIPLNYGTAILQLIAARPEIQYLVSFFQVPQPQLPTESDSEFSCPANYSFVTKVNPEANKECWLLQQSIMFATCRCTSCQSGGAVPGFGNSGTCKPATVPMTLMAYCPTSPTPIQAVRVSVPVSCRCMRSANNGGNRGGANVNANRPIVASNANRAPLF